MLRFTKLDDIKDRPIKTADVSFDDMADAGTTEVAFESKTWLDLKDILWNYHFDVMRTNQYSEFYPEEDRPKRLKIRLNRDEFFAEVPATEFTWYGPDGEPQTGEFVPEVGGRSEHYNYVGEFEAVGFNLAGEGIFHGPSVHITGIHDGEDFQYWTGTFTSGELDGESIGDGMPVFSTKFDLGEFPITFGPPFPVEDNRIPAHTEQSHTDHDVIEKFIVNFQSLTSDNVHGKFDDELPVPTDKGDWNATDNFFIDDQVTFNEETYYCTVPNKGRSPDDWPDYWTTEEPGERSIDRRTQIISAIAYWHSLSGYVAYIVDGIDTAFLEGEIADSDYRLKEIPGGDPPPPDAVPVHQNPFGFAIDSHFVTLGGGFVVPTETGYQNVYLSGGDGS